MINPCLTDTCGRLHELRLCEVRSRRIPGPMSQATPSPRVDGVLFDEMSSRDDTLQEVAVKQVAVTVSRQRKGI